MDATWKCSAFDKTDLNLSFHLTNFFPSNLIALVGQMMSHLPGAINKTFLETPHRSAALILD